MQCGAKCFLVEVEVQGEKKTKTVFARSPIYARKIIRKKYGTTADVLSVTKKK